MDSISTLNEVVSEIYDTLDDFSKWQSVLPKIGKLLGSEAGMLDFWEDGIKSDDKRIVSNFAESHSFSNEDHFSRLSSCYQHVRFREAPTVVTSAMLTPRRNYESIKTHDGLQISDGFRDSLVALIDKTSSGETLLSFVGKENQAPFSVEHVEMLRFLAPHVRRVCKLHLEIGNLNRFNGSMMTMLDTLSHGVVLLNQQGQVLHLNKEAQRILDADDGLSVTRQCLKCTYKSQSRLNAMILRTGEQDTDHALQTLLLERPSGNPHLISWVVPVRNTFSPGNQQAVHSIFMLSDPGKYNYNCALALELLYGLSRAEVQVVTALCSGMDANNIAQQRGVSINTIRTLRSRAYQKLSIQSQSELSKILSVLPMVH